MLTPEDIYSPEFLQKIQSIQLIYKDGDKKSALNKLSEINDLEVSDVELAKKYNFIGIIYFSEQDFDTAIENFEMARSKTRIDRVLTSQIYLNLASSYYKKDLYERAYSYLEQVDKSVFSKKEETNYYKLRLVLAQQLGKPKVIVESVIPLIGKKFLFSEIENHQYKEALVDNYRKLSTSERVYLLEKFDDRDAITTAYLAKEEALQRYYMGDRPGAEDVLSWLGNKYSHSDDVNTFIKDFQFRIENYSKIDVGAVGVLLPLTGEKGLFGKKALTGIDSALNHGDNKVLAAKIYTRDSKNNSFVAKKMINDLIQKHHVSIIIGGLFSKTAKEEYLEAKKYGVLFISLSPVHLKKEDKNHLLIEVPGSIESQVDAIMSPEFLNKFGNKIAMIYPETEGGLSYVNEVWRRSEQGLIKLSGIQSYERTNKDFRSPVSKILGLKFKRERKEEFEVWKDIYALEKKTSSIRRIQTLKPILDFDWVFAPAYPKDAIQIIPTFSYYDAKNLKFIGGPSWMSKSIVKEQRNLGKLFLIGDDPKDFDKSFRDDFKARNNKSPRLIETLSFEAMNLSLTVIEGTKFEKREELERRLINLGTIKGVTGNWNLKEGIWMKEMDFLNIQRGKIQKFDISQLEDKVIKEVDEVKQ
jgi:ABC-type branched-subunit amino acid transport system substrate-binding protein